MNETLIESVKEEYGTLLKHGDLAAAVPLIRQAANWGDLDSQKLAAALFLGKAYGHPVTEKPALEYLQMAALNEDEASMVDLARLYLDGSPTVRSADKAFYWLNKAAQRGFAGAFDLMGMLYLQGKGTACDLEKARFWLEEADAAGDANAKKHLRMVDLKQQKSQL